MIAKRQHGASFRRTSFRSVCLAVALLGSILAVSPSNTLAQQETNSAPTKTTLGVIRWDMWGESGKMMTERSLSPEKYHHRIPFFGKTNDPHELVDIDGKKYEAAVSFNGHTQEVMDQELAYANEAGIDYFAFVHYAPDARLSYARMLYKSSQQKGQVKFTYILGNPEDSLLPEIITDIGSPHWMRVLNERPLVFLMADEQQAPQAVQKINAAYQKTFLNAPPIYYVIMQYTDGGYMKTRLNAAGAQAGSAYCTWNKGGEGDHSYAGMANDERGLWQTYVNAGTNIVPWVTLGFDRRPRIDFVMPWESLQPNNWCENATPAQAEAQLQAALDFVKQNKPEANSILVYSWNEDDEGLGVVPKLGPGGTGVNREMLDTLKKVIDRNF